MNYAIDNVIFFGDPERPLYRFDNRGIVLNSISAISSVDVIGNELSVDAFTFRVRYDPRADIYAPVGAEGYETPPGPIYGIVPTPGKQYLTELPFGFPVFWFCDGVLRRKAYLKEIERTGKFEWKISCVSGVGLLDESIHTGGIYTGVGLPDIVAEIIGERFVYSIDSGPAAVAVTGWLPYDTGRRNLHKLLFATGATMVRDPDTNDYRITFLAEPEGVATIPPDRVALGGKSKLTLPATAAEVTEHSYFPFSGANPTILFETATGALRQTVVFGGPYSDLQTTGTLTIEESGENYAVVSGVGTLTGKPYAHTTMLVREGNDMTLVKRAGTDNGLVSVLNSRNVAKRVLAYYRTARSLDARIIYGGEQCGSFYNIEDDFGENSKGFLTQTTITPTSLVVAACKFIEGYAPTGQGNYFGNRDLLTESGNWVAQTSGRIRVLIVAGGDGGKGGFAGEVGYDDLVGYSHYYPGVPAYVAYVHYTEPHDAGGAGGSAGDAGAGGKYLMVELTVQAGDVLTFSIGTGGIGGAAEGGEGTAGTPTTMTGPGGTYTTEDGTASDEGIADALTGTVYGARGAAGLQGGAGGTTSQTDLEAMQGHGYAGENAGDASGGAGGNGAGSPSDWIEGNTLYAAGGGGGGAAFGSYGGAGGNARCVYGINVLSTGGNGGDGANAAAPALPAYGCGGGGGNGGGGGGNAGGAYSYGRSAPVHRGTAGSGGAGSRGGDGGNGCAVIYY